MTVKLHCFRKLVDHKDNCAFDESGVMGLCSGGLASHRGPPHLQKMTKDGRKLFFFFAFGTNKISRRGEEVKQNTMPRTF